MGREDNLLEGQRQDWEKSYPFVPICRGVTFFQIQACKGEELVDQWPASAPPSGVKVTISFAEPYETVRGTRDVVDELKISRTFAINTMRKIKFAMEGSGDPNAPADPNQPDVQKQPSEKSAPAGGRNAAGRTTNERTTNKRTTDQRTTDQRTTGTQSPRGSVSNERAPKQTRRE
jgi:hypothetical protein